MEQLALLGQAAAGLQGLGFLLLGLAALWFVSVYADTKKK